jgi:hypothetical protein
MNLSVAPVEITSGATVYRHFSERNHDFYVPEQFFDSRPAEHTWRRCPSKDHAGKVYYANKASGKSEWSLPEVPAQPSATSVAPAGPMIGKLDDAQVATARMSIQESIRQRLLARMGKDQPGGAAASPVIAPAASPLVADKSAASPLATPPAGVQASQGTSDASPDENNKSGGVRDRIAAWRAGRGSSAGRPATPQHQAGQGGFASPVSVSPTKGINLAAVESDATLREAPTTSAAQPAIGKALRLRDATPVSGKVTPAQAPESIAESIAKDVYEEKRRQMLEADEALRREKEVLLRQERANQERLRVLSEQRLAEEETYTRLIESRRIMEQRRLDLERQQMDQAVLALGRAREAQMLREAADAVDHYQQAHEQMQHAAEAEKARAMSFADAISRSLVGAAVSTGEADSPARANAPGSGGKSPKKAPTFDDSIQPGPINDAEMSLMQASLVSQGPATGPPQRRKTETVVYGPALTYIGEVTVSARGGMLTKHGHGQMYYDKARASFYDGQWSGDEKSGFGVMSLPNSHFEGEWRRNKLHGRSTMQTQKLKASLQLKHGQPAGNVIAELATGGTFAGRVVSGGDRPQAVFGTLRLTTSDTVEWMWEDPRSPGTGDAKVHFAEGDSFVGAVQAYSLHGRGAYHFAEGHEYIGEFERGAMTGRGLFRFQNGNVYEGALRGGVFHGQGKYSQQQEYIYEGEWVEGHMHGKGVVKYRNGDVWEGVMDKDRRMKGRYTSSKQFQLPPT